MQGELFQTGTVLVEEISIINQYDESTGLSEFYTELNIFEDMYSPCIFAELLITDNINLIANLPIVGNEMVIVKLRTPTFEDLPGTVIEKTFHVYSIKNKTLSGDRQSSYTLELISAEGYLNLQSTLANSFSGRTDEIAAQIFEEYLTYNNNSTLVINDVEHKSRLKYTSNFWSPFKNLSYISKRCQGKEGQASDFLFFESKNCFMLTSSEHLIKTQVQGGLFDEYVYELVPGTFKRKQGDNRYYGVPVIDEMTRVISVKTPKLIDSIENVQNGYYASSIRSFDFTTKKIVESRFDMSSSSTLFNKTDTNIPIPRKLSDNPFVHTKFLPVNTSLYNNYGTSNIKNLPAGHPADFIVDKTHYRNSYLNSLLHTRFEITIHGRTDIAVGQCINFLYPAAGHKTTSDTAIDAVDKYLSGVFLITAVRHLISNDKHTMQVEIVKNGYAESVS